MNFRSKPVRQIADHGEPTACIQQVTDGIADRRHLESFHRALFAAAERSLINKGKVALAPLLMGLGKATLMVALGPRSPLSWWLLIVIVTLSTLSALCSSKMAALTVSVAVKVTRAVALRVCWAGSSWALIT